jgi:hypothetical protein
MKCLETWHGQARPVVCGMTARQGYSIVLKVDKPSTTDHTVPSGTDRIYPLPRHLADNDRLFPEGGGYRWCLGSFPGAAC